MKLNDLTASEEVLAEHLRDPDFRREWERTVVARAVAVKVIAYRAQHGLSQRALVQRSQPQVARLEAGEHNPTMKTLTRLAPTLDVEFAMDIRRADRFPSSSADTSTA